MKPAGPQFQASQITPQRSWGGGFPSGLPSSRSRSWKPSTDALIARAGAITWDTQVFYRPSDLETAEFLQRCLGRRSGYAHSESVGEGAHTSEGLSEQAVPLMTAQAIKQMGDEDIIGFHRGTAPFRAKRMDWRGFGELGRGGSCLPLGFRLCLG